MRDRITNVCPKKHNPQGNHNNTTISWLILTRDHTKWSKTMFRFWSSVFSGFKKMTHNKTATSFDVALILYQLLYSILPKQVISVKFK